MQLACPFSLGYYVWLDWREAGGPPLSGIQEWLTRAGLTVKDSQGWSKHKLPSDNPTFAAAYDTIGPDHEIEYLVRPARDDSLAVCFILSPRDDMVILELGDWQNLRRKYEEAYALITQALDPDQKTISGGQRTISPPLSLEYRIDAVAGLENEGMCIDFSRKDIRAILKTNDITGLDIIGNVLLNRIAFIDLRGLDQMAARGHRASQDNSEGGSSKTSRMRGHLMHFGAVSECRSDFPRFAREMLDLSRSLAKLEQHSSDTDDINRMLTEKIGQIDGILASAERIALATEHTDRQSSRDRVSMSERLRLMESRKMSLADAITELSALDGKLSEWESRAIQDSANVRKGISDIDFFYKMTEGRNLGSLPNLCEIWNMEYSRVIDRYSEIRERISHSKRKTKNVYEWARYVYDEAKLELDSARNRLVAFATVAAELLIGTEVVISISHLDLALWLRLGLASLALCILVPITFFVVRNLVWKPERSRTGIL